MVHDLEFVICSSEGYEFRDIKVPFLVYAFVGLGISEHNGVISCTDALLSLLERIKDRQYDASYLLVLRYIVLQGSVKEVVFSMDGVLRL